MSKKWIKNGYKVFLSMLLCSSVLADEVGSLDVNAAISTDYVFRYISQTQEDSAVSGGVDWESGSGFYLGAWGSTVDFDDDARLELDFYGGYQFDTENGVNLNFGLIDYEYFNDAANDNILEGFASVGKGIASLTVYYDLKDGDYYWLEGGLEHEFSKFTTSLTVGTLLPEHGDGYSGWSLGASLPFRSINYSVTAFGTDSDGKAAFGKLADTRLVFGIDTQF